MGLAELEVSARGAHMLGHSSAGIVMTYAKAIDEARRDAVHKLEATYLE